MPCLHAAVMKHIPKLGSIKLIKSKLKPTKRVKIAKMRMDMSGIRLVHTITKCFTPFLIHAVSKMSLTRNDIT